MAKKSTMERVDHTGSLILRLCGVVIGIVIVCNLIGTNWLTMHLAQALGLALLTFIVVFIVLWVSTQGLKGFLWSLSEIFNGQARRYWPDIKEWLGKKFGKKPKPATPPAP